MGRSHAGQMIEGTLTGSGTGNQTQPTNITGGYVYIPCPLDWVRQSGTYTYSWHDEDPPNVWAEALGHIYTPNGDLSPYVNSNGTSAVRFALASHYLWQVWWDDGDTGTPPPTTGKPTPPASQQFLLQTQLLAWAKTSYNGNGYDHNALDYHGLSASVLLKDDVFNESVTAVAPSVLNSQGFSTASQSAGGKYLVTSALQMVKGKPIYTVTLTGSGQAQAVAAIKTKNTDGSADARATLDGFVTKDNRAVTISADADVTYYKLLIGGVDANGDGKWTKAAHAREITGTMKGDIGIAYGSRAHSSKGAVVVIPSNKSVKYNGHLIGTWATQDSHYWWDSSLKNFHVDHDWYRPFKLGYPVESDLEALTNNYIGPVVDTETGVITPNEAATNGTHDIISFRFRNGDNRTVYPAPQFATGNDGDGAIAAATYDMTIHQPVENFPSHKPNEIRFRIATPFPRSGTDDIPMSFQGIDHSTYKGTDSNGVGSNGITAICVLNSPSVGLSLSSDVTAALSSIPYPGQYAVLSVIFAGANIFINHAASETINFAADFNDIAWNDSLSDGDSSFINKKGSKADYQMSPRVRVKYRWMYKLVDVYNTKGFR